MKRGSFSLIAVGALSVLMAGLLWVWLGAEPIAFTFQEDRYEILIPQALAGLGILPLLIWVATHSLADLPRLQKWLGVGLRFVLVGALLFALARVVRTTDTTKISTVFLVDVSDSVTPEAIEDARRLVQAALQDRGENDVQLVTFAREARAIPIPDGGELPAIERHVDSPGAGRATNLQAALQLAYGLFPPAHLRRAVLISDGGQTDGDLLAEATRAATFGVRLYYHPYRRGAPQEVAIQDLDVPEQIRVGEPFAVRAQAFSNAQTTVRVRLYQGETLNGLDGVRDIELTPGDHEISFESVVRVAGPVTYRIEMEPEGPDRFHANNRFETTVVVPGRPTVLYVEGAQGRGGALARALTAADYEVDVRSPRAIPTSLRELERFDFFILSDVAADQVSLTQQATIERYVRDLGGGFLMAGGENGYSLGGWQDTLVERLLPVRMDAQRRRDQPSLALALVIDRSGSMSGQKIELAKEAARATAELLGAEDYIEVIGFDSRPERIVSMQSAGNRMRILRDIGRMSARGGTAIQPALLMAYDDLSLIRAQVKHVILLTDGQTDEPDIPDLVQIMRSDGMTLSTVGLGQDVNRGLLQSIATVGGGRAYFTNDPHNVPRIFMRETTTVARSSAVEEYFQPAVVHPADFLRSVDIRSAPFLQGYVATRMKPHPAQLVLQSDLAEPILARWRVGLGWSLAWTSDVKNRWAVDWLRWNGFSRFWGQLVREHMRQRRRETLDMFAEIVGGEARVHVEAIDQADSFMNDLDSTLTIEGPMGLPAPPRRRDQETSDHDAETSAESRVDESNYRTREEVPLRQTAPGRYEARIPLDRYGSFMLTASHEREGRPIAESTAQLANPYPREYGTFEVDEEILARATDATGGSAEPAPSILFDPGDEQIETHEEMWPKFLLLALALFLLDLLMRRVRVFDRKFNAAVPAK